MEEAFFKNKPAKTAAGVGQFSGFQKKLKSFDWTLTYQSVSAGEAVILCERSGKVLRKERKEKD